MHAKDRASEARAKHAEVGVGFASPTQPSLPFCPGVQFSRDSIRAFNDQIKIRDIAGCEQSNAYITKRTLYSGSKDIEITSWKARAYGIFTWVGEVSEIERVSAANEWDFWYKANECENPVQSAFHAEICLFHTYWDFCYLSNFNWFSKIITKLLY